MFNPERLHPKKPGIAARPMQEALMSVLAQMHPQNQKYYAAKLPSMSPSWQG